MFALLVQLKSQEINARAVGDAFQRERAALVEEHGRLCRERDLLRCSVEDKAAQLQLEQERNCGLVDSLKQQSAELAGSQQQAVGLERVVCEVCTGLRGIPSLVDHHRSVLQQVQTRLLGYEQRLGFAARRLQTVEGVLCEWEGGNGCVLAFGFTPALYTHSNPFCSVCVCGCMCARACVVWVRVRAHVCCVCVCVLCLCVCVLCLCVCVCVCVCLLAHCVCVVLCGRLRSRLTTTVSTQTGDVDTHEEGAGAGLAGPGDLQTLSRWELVSEVVQLSKERQALCDHISKLETSYKTAAAEKEEECT